MSAKRECPIVLLGADDDEHICALAAELSARGEQPLVIDPRRFPRQLPVSLGADPGDIRIGERSGLLPRSVYVRNLYSDPLGYKANLEQAMQEDWRRTSIAASERWHVLTSVLLRWSALDVPVYNPAQSALTLSKPYQLSLLRSAGLPVPSTLWTNDPNAVQSFCAQHSGVVYKPVHGGAHTRALQPRDLEPNRLAKLGASPVCFQELLPGRNLRVYVVDDRVVCALSVEAEGIDFREESPRVSSVQLGPELEQQCVRAMRCLGLRFTGMDLREDAEGRARILELNSSPMFLGFEQLGGVSIGRFLCDALVRGAGVAHPRTDNY